MANMLPRGAAYVCRACRSKKAPSILLTNTSSNSEMFLAIPRFRHEQRKTLSNKIPTSRSSRTSPSQAQTLKQSHPPRPQDLEHAKRDPTTASVVHIKSKDVQGTLRDIQRQVNAICTSQSLPEEAVILEVMDKAYQFANLLVFNQIAAPDEQNTDLEEEDRFNGHDFLSELDEPPPQTSQKPSSPASPASTLSASSREQSAQTLSESIYTLLKDPKIHISEPVLSTYVRIMCQLGNPEYLPEIFFLYAHKPQPIPNSHPIQYRNPSPNSPKNAIPQPLSDAALDTAILQRDLPLAVAIIDTTVGTRAFRLNKFVRKASLPLALVGSTPIAAYAAADWVANWQNSLDPQMAKAVTLMGSAAYIGTLTTIGFVAVTTWNDHHERVRWTEGTPLRHRWTREEERLYFDRIAMAWGFQRRRRRGEEMGRLWEDLREECGLRGLVLDKSDLLPGMQ